MSEYTKPFLTFDAQAEKLIDRGLVCDFDELRLVLSHVGYYRFSGYSYPYFSKKNNRFHQETTLEKIMDDYVFDEKLRILVFEIIEKIEIYFRTQLAYYLGEENKFGFLSSENLPRLTGAEHKYFLERCKQSYARSSETFVKHFENAYGDEHTLPPYWILVNLLDFGCVFTLFRGSSNEIRKTIADKLDLKVKICESWLKTLNTIRNICAHHARLWNKTLGIKPKIPKDEAWQSISGNKMFGVLVISLYLLDKIEPERTVFNKVLDFINVQNYQRLQKMGFPENWKEILKNLNITGIKKHYVLGSSLKDFLIERMPLFRKLR